MEANYVGSWKIPAAALFSTVLIVGAYVIARDAENPSTAQASTETELLEKISARDSDNDGLRDWEETLYGTDPHKQDSRNLGMADGVAVTKGLIVPVAPTPTRESSSPSVIDPSLPVPAEGTLTRALAESFITTYAKAVQRSPNGTLSSSDIQKVSNDVLAQFSEALTPAPDFRSLQSLKKGVAGPEAMREFAASMETVLITYKAYATTSELTYLQRVLDNNDDVALLHIASIAKGYRDTAVGLAALPVPPELANDYLVFVNSIARLGGIIEDFTRANSDPIATILALKQYPVAAQALGSVLINITGTYKKEGIVFTQDQPGYRLLTIIDRIIARQKETSGTTTP